MNEYYWPVQIYLDSFVSEKAQILSIWCYSYQEQDK